MITIRLSILTLLCILPFLSEESRAEIVLTSPANGKSITTVSPELRAFLDLRDSAKNKYSI